MVSPVSQGAYRSRTVHLPIADSHDRLDSASADAVLATLAQTQVQAIEIFPYRDLERARLVLKELKKMKTKFKKVGAVSGGLAAGSTAVASIPLVEAAAAPLTAGVAFASNYYGVVAGASAGREEGMLLERRGEILESARNFYKGVALRLLNRYLEGEYGAVAAQMEKRLGAEGLEWVKEESVKHARERQSVEELSRAILENMKQALMTELIESKKIKRAPRTEQEREKAAKKELKKRKLPYTKAEIERILEPLKTVCQAIDAHSPDQIIKLGFKHEFEAKRLDHEQKILETYIKKRVEDEKGRQKATDEQLSVLQKSNKELLKANSELQNRLADQEAAMKTLMRRLKKLEKRH